MHRPTIIFLLSHKITTVQQKTKTKLHQTNTTNNHDIQSTAINNHIYQSQKMVTTNIPNNLSIKNTLKQTVKTNTKTISRQSIVKSITQTIA